MHKDAHAEGRACHLRVEEDTGVAADARIDRAHGATGVVGRAARDERAQVREEGIRLVGAEARAHLAGRTRQDCHLVEDGLHALARLAQHGEARRRAGGGVVVCGVRARVTHAVMAAIRVVVHDKAQQ